MIEGLRIAPFYFDAQREGRVAKSCEECRINVSTEARQSMGCGYESAVADARPWTPSAWIDRGIEPSVCAGYSTNLPAVSELINAYPQWELGTLSEYLDAAPSSIALDYLAVFRAGIREYEAFKMSKAGKGGAS